MILNLEGEKSTGMYATGNYDLAKTLGKKLNEYGNSTLFIFVDISGSRSVSDETIAEILSNADLIQIQEGQGDLERATGYLKRLADKTEYHDYTIEELTRYLPKEKKLYSVSDIFSAYNRWYGSGLKTHIYKAYKQKDLVKIQLKKKTDKPYVELQKMVGLSDVKKVTDEILAAAKMQKMRKQMGLPGGSVIHAYAVFRKSRDSKDNRGASAIPGLEGRGSAEIWPHCRVRQTGSGRKICRLDGTDC